MSYNEIRTEEFEIDIVKLLKFYLDKIWLILLIGILEMAIAFGYSKYFVEPTYKSTVKMYVNNNNVSLGEASISISSATISTSQSLVSTYIEILKTRSTLENVIDDAQLKDLDGNRMKYDTLLSMINASAVKDTAIFEVQVTDTDPERAKLIANKITQVLPYQITAILEGSSVKVVDFAISGIKVGPNLFKNMLIGFLIGVVLVCIIEFFVFLNDSYIHDEDYLIENYNFPLLSVIPDLHGPDSVQYDHYGKYRYNYKYKGYGYRKYGGYHKYAYGYSQMTGNNIDNLKTDKSDNRGKKNG